MKVSRKIGIAVVVVLYAAYFFGVARPVPPESVLVPRWLSSLESGESTFFGEKPQDLSEAGPFLPFDLGSRFGYVDSHGNFSVNQIKKANVSLSADRWAEYDAEPDRIEIFGSSGDPLTVVENPRGYPFFLDGRNFLIGNEQNTVTEIDDSGAVIWTYEFSSVLTCVDAAAGLLLAGLVDGYIEVLDSEGKQVFLFAPGGSGYAIILGCAISGDGSRIGLISGIEPQRFIMLERYGTGITSLGGTIPLGISAGNAGYRVIHHEFLDNGYRRPVHIGFVENDRWIIYEREEGLGLYRIGSKQGGVAEFEGEICAIDNTGGQGVVFVIVAHSGNEKELIGINLPGRVALKAPFKSWEVFLKRTDSGLFVGGAQNLFSFTLEKR